MTSTNVESTREPVSQRQGETAAQGTAKLMWRAVLLLLVGRPGKLFAHL